MSVTAPQKVKEIRNYTVPEEIWHTSVHAVGIVFGVSILTLLLVLSCIYGNVWSIVSCAIFGTTVILMYTASTLYHAVSDEAAKKVLKKLDHIAIYYLIAGTYTPFLLVNMRERLGWLLFVIIWALAFLGTYLKLKSGMTKTSGVKFWSIALYLCMGWLIAFAVKPMIDSIPTIGLVFLLLGGVFYTAGIFFYVWKSKPYTHAIWHFFVLLGTIMHFFAVLFSCVFI